jgi:hypothetical protein
MELTDKYRGAGDFTAGAYQNAHFCASQSVVARALEVPSEKKKRA